MVKANTYTETFSFTFTFTLMDTVLYFLSGFQRNIQYNFFSCHIFVPLGNCFCVKQLDDTKINRDMQTCTRETESLSVVCKY